MVFSTYKEMYCMEFTALLWFHKFCMVILPTPTVAVSAHLGRKMFYFTTGLYGLARCI